MNFLQQLQTEKAARESYERDKIRLKEAISKISDLHSAYDGGFLLSLEQFLANFKPTNDDN